MLVISTRDFRANQTKFLDMVNNGEDIVLKSREKAVLNLSLSKKKMPLSNGT